MVDPRAQHKEVHAPLPVQQQEFPGEASLFETSEHFAVI
jgi:hypothetical protein